MARVTSSSSATTIGIQSTNGGTLTSTGTALDVNVVGSTPAGTPTYTYNEITAVPIGVETTITSYTAPLVGNTYLKKVHGASTNIGIIKVYIDAPAIDKTYLTFTRFSFNLDWVVGNGYPVPAGAVVTVKGENKSLTAMAANFNATIQTVTTP